MKIWAPEYVRIKTVLRFASLAAKAGYLLYYKKRVTREKKPKSATGSKIVVVLRPIIYCLLTLSF